MLIEITQYGVEVDEWGEETEEKVSRRVEIEVPDDADDEEIERLVKEQADPYKRSYYDWGSDEREFGCVDDGAVAITGYEWKKV